MAEKKIRAALAQSAATEMRLRSAGILPIRDQRSQAAIAAAETKRARRAKRGW